MEQAYCTAVFWRGGEKIDLNGLKPDAVRCLSVTGERKVAEGESVLPARLSQSGGTDPNGKM